MMIILIRLEFGVAKDNEKKNLVDGTVNPSVEDLRIPHENRSLRSKLESVWPSFIILHS